MPLNKSSRGNAKVSVSIARKAIALTIAGSDPSGGAGLQADIKAFQQNGVYGMSAVTVLTVQNTERVQRVVVLDAELVKEQIESVMKDIPPLAIKTGALGSVDIIRVVEGSVKSFHGDLIVDPVLISKHGDRLGDSSMIDAYRQRLFPIATMVTPNRFETEAILNRKLTDLDSFCQAAYDLQQLGPSYVLIKAGVIDGIRQHIFAGEDSITSIGLEDRPGNHGHGAGCSLSATIAARLALSNPSHPHALRVKSAVEFAIAAVHASVTLANPIGNGCHPVEHRVLDRGDSVGGRSS